MADAMRGEGGHASCDPSDLIAAHAVTEGTSEPVDGAWVMAFAVQVERNGLVGQISGTRQVGRQPAFGGQIVLELGDVELWRPHRGMNHAPNHPTMSTPIFTNPYPSHKWAVNSAGMSRRAPRAGGRTAPAFGRWLKECREALKTRCSLQQIERRLGEAGGHVVTGSTLQRYEKGRAPDVLTIYVLSDLYSFDFSEAMLRLAKELENPTSVLDQNAETGVELPSAKGGAHESEAVALRAEIVQLRDDIAVNVGLLEGITDRLATLASGEDTHGRVPRTGTHKPKRR